MEKLSPAMENYLKIIYSISEFGNRNSIRVQDIASHMKLSRASVSHATALLSKKGLLHKGRYTTISLTEAGKEQAHFIVKRHRIIQKFLCSVLKINAKLAAENACSIEHVITSDCYQSICEYIEKQEESCRC